MQSIFHRLISASVTVPRAKDWLQAIGLLLAFALLYLPIGFALKFLKLEVQSSWQTIINVSSG